MKACSAARCAYGLQRLRADQSEWTGKLYKSNPKAAKKTTLTALPYYLWCNRGSNRMLVWVPETGKTLKN